MDFFNKAYSQVADLFRSMTPAARITTGLLLAVVVISLVFLFRREADHADEDLFGNQTFTDREVAAMEAAFAKAGLNDWVSQGNRVRVPRAKRNKYIAALAEGDALPENFETAWRQMFVTASPFKSRQMQELEAHHASEKRLAFVIRNISGIEIADVSMSEIDKGGLRTHKEKHALVSVKATGNRELDERQVNAIRRMVASGGGVDKENITVADLNSGDSYPGTGKGGPAGALDNIYAATQRKYEADVKAKIEKHLLSMYPGVKVGVHVELEKELVNQSTVYKVDDKSTPVQTTTFTKETTSTGPQAGGPAGTRSNDVTSTGSLAVSNVAASESTATENREDQSSVYGFTQSHTEKPPLVPTWVTASIGIPASCFERIWRRRNPPAAGQEPKQPDPAELDTIKQEEIKKIEEAVVKLLPRPPQGEDPFPRVKVFAYTETPLPVPESPGLAETAVSWLGANWQVLGMFALALASVLLLRGMIRSTQNDSPPQSEQLSAARLARLEDDNEEQEEVINSLKKRFQTSGRSLRDELTELVREDPDAAANVLQNWIGDAA